MRYFVASLAALIAFASPPGHAAAAPAHAAAAPALWLVQGAKAKVYLFGTIHILKPDVAWSTPVIDDALAHSDDLWLEIPNDPNDAASIVPQMQALGMDPDHPLSTKITKADLDLLDARIKAAGLPGEEVFERFRPWLAALSVELLPAMKAGYSGQSGVETTLRSKMKAAGKPIEGLETIDEQLHLFADLSQAQEVALLHSALAAEAAKDDLAAIDKLEASWQSGDVDQVARDEAKFDSVDPSFAAVMLTNRNAKWAKKLDERLHGAGTSFVAVGMLHLVGSKSVIDDLTKLGYTVRRVE